MRGGDRRRQRARDEEQGVASQVPSGEAVDRGSARNFALALGRGLIGRCPNCGKGALFRSCLRVNDRCPACGEDLSAERADDAPAFVTLLLTCFLCGAGVLLSDALLPNVRPLVAAVILGVVAAALSVLMLPRVKGAVVASQWSLRMHGFGGERPPASQ